MWMKSTARELHPLKLLPETAANMPKKVKSAHAFITKKIQVTWSRKLLSIAASKTVS